LEKRDKNNASMRYAFKKYSQNVKKVDRKKFNLRGQMKKITIQKKIYPKDMPKKILGILRTEI